MSSNSPMQQLSAAAIEYFEQGFTPIPEIDLRPDREIRKPVFSNYAAKTWDSIAQISRAFLKSYDIYEGTKPDQVFVGNYYPNGVSILLGRRSGGLIDIDLDSEYSVQLAPLCLPSTRVFGRPGNRGSHWVYLCPSMTENDEVYSEYKGNVKIEMRTGAPRQVKTHFPGSINAGELVEWENDSEIRVINDISSLRVYFDYLAAATLLCSLWEDGRRTDLATAVCGALARSIYDDAQKEDQDPEQTKGTIRRWDKILRRIGEIRDDRGFGRRLTVDKAYRDLVEAERMQANGGQGPRVQGVASLYRILEKEDARNLVKWLGLKDAPQQAVGRPPGSSGGGNEPDADATERLHEFNHDHAMIVMGGKLRVAIFDPDGGFTLLSVKDAAELYAVERPVFIEVGERVRAIPLFQFWKQWEGRRTITKVIFDPTNQEHPATTHNTWRGWGVEPKAGDCSLYLDHIRNVIAGGNEHYGKWIIAWLADLIQNPAKRTGTAIVLRGEMGVGKGEFAQPILRLVGKAGLHLNDSSRISGRFNSQLANKLVVFADEAWYAGDKAHSGKLKALITEASIDIEHKGLETYTVDNYLRLIMASNLDWVAPSGEMERRFAIFDVESSVQQNRTYFGAMRKQMMQDGGDEALLHYLQNFDLRQSIKDGVNPAVVPRTVACGENAIMSADSAVQWIYTYASSGEFARLTQSGSEDPEKMLLPGNSIRPSRLYDVYYLDWCNSRRAMRPVAYTTFNKRLNEHGFIREGNSVSQVVVLPTLVRVQSAMCKRLGVEMFEQIGEDYAPDAQVVSTTPYDDEIPF